MCQDDQDSNPAEQGQRIGESATIGLPMPEKEHEIESFVLVLLMLGRYQVTRSYSAFLLLGVTQRTGRHARLMMLSPYSAKVIALQIPMLNVFVVVVPGICSVHARFFVFLRPCKPLDFHELLDLPSTNFWRPIIGSKSLHYNIIIILYCKKYFWLKSLQVSQKKLK